MPALAFHETNGRIVTDRRVSGGFSRPMLKKRLIDRRGLFDFLDQMISIAPGAGLRAARVLR
jgi:hypothetical protein